MVNLRQTPQEEASSSQERQIQACLLFDCSADSDNSKLIKGNPKIDTGYQAALPPWESRPVNFGCQLKPVLMDPPPQLLSLSSR